MLRRTRTTKKLAKRIDLQYFARPHPLRQWRFWLSVAVPALALGWVLAQRAQGGQKVYSSGPLSASHAVFTKQCSLVPRHSRWSILQGGKRRSLPELPRRARASGKPDIHAAMSTCHAELGARCPSATSERNCTQCHAHLETRNGQPHYADTISGFDGSHPEFSVLAKRASDPGKIRLNHYLHLLPNLLGPDGKRVQMACEDCHRAGSEGEDWPYGAHVVRSAVSEPVADARLNRHSSYMAPIRFASHCAACRHAPVRSTFR